MVSVGSIIGGGFRLFREQPLAVLVWGVIYGALTVASMMWLPAMMRMQLAAAGGGSPGALLQWMIPFYLAMIVVALVMTVAAFRAVMRPEASAAAFLRFGGDELRLLVLAIVWLVINLVLYFMAILLGVTVAGIMAGSNGSSAGIALLFGVVIALPVLCLMIFVHIRLSPAIPLTLLRRKIIIGDAWRLTRGHFWVLFTGYLIVVLMLVLAYLLVAAVTMGGYFTMLTSGGFTPQSIDAANQYRLAQMSAVTPFTILGWLLSAAYGAVSYAMWAGSVSTATQELLGLTATDYAATFE